ncbi:MAG: branched-chain amino acid ABC transporter permease [Betaproteobacteria bacterium]
MNASLLFQSGIVGITNGFVYALVGLGIAVVFRGTRIINAMQGEFSLVGGMVAFLVVERLRLPLALAAAAGVLAGGVLGFVMEFVLVRPTRRRGASEESYLLLTLGVAFAISASVLYFIGRDSRSLPGIGGEGSALVFDAAVRYHALWLVVLSSAVMLLLRWFYGRTLIGLSMMAASIDEEGAATIGIDVPLMRSLSFLLGGLVGGLAGVLVSPLITIHYEMGLLLTLKGFAAAILGGLVNPFGALVGGVTLGLIESLAVVSVSSGYKDVIAMTLLIVIMIFMPNGILGRGSRKGG